jgi:membrane-associated phospholipid phosphatase
MNSLRRLLKQHADFFLFFSTAISVAVMLLGSSSKINCFLSLNGIHTKWLDIIFINLTFLGDGLFSIIAAALVFFLWKLHRLSLHIIVAYLMSGLTAQLLKRLFMAPRPREIITARMYQSFLEGITGVGWDSFPSGHTTSVFALATIMALHVNKKSWGLFFLIMAILVGYSRIYLGQHFLQDVVAGAILGTGIGVVVYSFVNFRKGFSKRKTSGKDSTGEAGYSSTLAGN